MDGNRTKAIPDIASMSNVERGGGQEIAKTLIFLREAMDSVRKGSEIDSLETVISSLQEALDNEKYDEDNLSIVRCYLMKALLTRYGIFGWIEDLDACLLHLNELTDDPDSEDSSCSPAARSWLLIQVAFRGGDEKVDEAELASTLIQACRDSLNFDILNTVISVANEALLAHTQANNDKNTPHIADIQIVFGNALVMKYLNQGGAEVLDQAAMRFRQLDSRLACTRLMLLAHIEFLRFMEIHDPKSSHPLEKQLTTARDTFHQLLDHITLEGETDEEGINLLNIGNKMMEDAVNNTQLQKAITVLRASLHRRTAPHPRRIFSLHHLTCALFAHFKRTGTSQDLEECILLRREALGLRPKPYQNRPLLLNNLAITLLARFEQEGAIKDLEECMALNREALNLLPASHPDRSATLDNLAIALLTLFEQKGTFQDLEESIIVHREALDLHPPHHPDRYLSLNNLARAISTRFQHRGSFQDLEDCITFYREALGLVPGSHPYRSTVLDNLAGALLTRFEQRRIFQDLEESIVLLREALDLRPSPHPERSSSLNNLANALDTRFEHKKGTLKDLEECIMLHREALDLRPLPHPGRSMSLSNLARVLSNRFQHQGALQDLEECIELHRKALDLRPAPHPDRFTSLKDLGDIFLACSQRTGAFRDHNPADVLSANNLAHTPNSSHIENALHYYEQASKYETGPLVGRLVCSKHWAACAAKHQPAAALDAYRYAMALLPLLASLDLSLQQRQDVLQNSQDLVGEAVQCAIGANELDEAIIFLSTGRSIFWSQALQLRSPVDKLRVINAELTKKFTDICGQLEDASYCGHHGSEGFPKKQYSANAYTSLYALSKQRSKLTEEIRRIPGLEGFLLPPSIHSLRAAAEDGPVVLLSESRVGCDALVLCRTGAVKQIPLSGVYVQHLEVVKIFMHAPLASGKRSQDNIHWDRTMDVLQASLGRDMIPDDSNDSDRDTFSLALGYLWIKIVQPVLKALNIEKADSEVRERVWWCLTGSFASLPIHAAGIYSNNNSPIDCIFQYVITSYCISPQDLLHPPSPVAKDFKMMAIIEHEAPGAPNIPFTLKELVNIVNRIPGKEHLSQHIGTKAAPNRVKDLLPGIQQSSFVHFGCHGKQNLKNPLESCLLLSEGKLTMAKVMECRVSEGALAYLSACETAKGDEERPDESLNLVATMMFAGFRSVVGTLWSIIDDDAPIVADVFYQHLFRNGKETPPDVRDAAYISKMSFHLSSLEAT